ncbi:ROK family protein [Pseudonocardia nematodicida]|uniref:ROK family protein n=1 Tax=Pseudonocardia nematodicida TaxID=1206997 RepID=A0ABN0MYW3_9PSEU
MTVPVLEIGGTHVTAALVDPEAARVLDSLRRPLHAEAPAGEIVGDLVACAAGLGPAVADHWGVAIPGPFDYERGVGLFSGVAKFEGLHGVDLRAALLPRLPGGPTEITFLNDAHAFALGEWVRCGAPRRMVGITLGTGVGGAFLADGVAVRSGPEVPPGGVVHLLTHAGRPLEDTVSRRALRRTYAAVSGNLDADVHEIAEAARAGDPVARTVFDDAFRALGSVLAPWLERFCASTVVVGGSVAGSWDLVAGPLRAGLDLPGVDLVRARHLHDAALLGAAWHTRRDSDDNIPGARR